MSAVIERARQLRKLIEQASEGLDDRTASEGHELLPRMKTDGSLIPGGHRIQWRGRVMRARTALWANEENTPERAPQMWEEVGYRQGIRVIPAAIAAENPFAKGERGWWGEALYESLYDANVHTPEAWPEGWAEISEKSTV